MVEQVPQRPRLEVGRPVRVKDTAAIRSAEGVIFDDVTYVICWISAPTEFTPEHVLILSKPVAEEIMQQIRQCTSESDVMQVLTNAQRASYFVPEKDVFFDVRAHNQRT